MSYSVFWF